MELTKSALRKEKLKKASHLLAGVIMLVHADFLFFAIEATLSLIVAYEYFHMGKTGLPFMYLFAGLMQLSAIYILFRKANK